MELHTYRKLLRELDKSKLSKVYIKGWKAGILFAAYHDYDIDMVDYVELDGLSKSYDNKRENA